MNHEAVSALFFDEAYVVPAEQSARKLFATFEHGSGHSHDMADVMATACLVAVIESICIGELACHVDATREIILGTRVDCRHRGVVPPGARLRIAGWVQAVGENYVTFYVFAQDEQEEVCEGTITLATVARDRLDRTIVHKTEAIARRELFAPA